MNRRLYRSPNDRVLAGVAGGMAEAYDFDPAIARVVWTLLILFTGGVFLIVYIVMALVVPLRPSDEPYAYDENLAWAAGPPPGPGAPLDPGAPSGSTFETDSTTIATAGSGVPPSHYAAARPPRPRPDSTTNNAPVVIGAILILIGALFLARQFIAIDLGRLWPIAVIIIGLLLVISALGRGRRRA